MKQSIIFLGLFGLIHASYHPFGNKWFHGDGDSNIGHQDEDSVIWEFENKHLENNGLVTHFDPIPVEENKEIKFQVKWKSDAKETDCGSKYWTEHTYHHQCYDEDVDGGNYPGVPSECVKEPRCLVNTGDFRVVLADSNGDRVDEDKFGDLDDKSKKWQGVQFRFHPHVFHRDLVHKSPHIPTNLLLRKNDDHGIFSTKSNTKKHIWEGAFEVAPGDEDTLTIRIKKLSSKEFSFSIEMNGYEYEHTTEYDKSEWVPEQFDTFAVAQPNLRGYTYLELRKP